MEVAASRRWRVSVEDGKALIERRNTRYDGGPAWDVIAHVPMDDALAIARTLMHEHNRPLSHEAVAAMEAG